MLACSGKISCNFRTKCRNFNHSVLLRLPRLLLRLNFVLYTEQLQYGSEIFWYLKFLRRVSSLVVPYRAVGRSENPGVPVLFGGYNLPPLVEIGLTDLPKFGGAMAPPAPPGTTGLPWSGIHIRDGKINVECIKLS